MYTVTHSVSKTGALSFFKGIQENAAGNSHSFHQPHLDVFICDYKSELHFYLKLTIWTGNLSGIYVPTLSLWLNPEWPLPSPQAGCTFRACPHTAAQPHSAEQTATQTLQGSHFSTGSSTSWTSKLWIPTVPFYLSLVNLVLWYSPWLTSSFSPRCFVFQEVHHRWGADLSAGAGYSLCLVGGKTTALCFSTHFCLMFIASTSICN